MLSPARAVRPAGRQAARPTGMLSRWHLQASIAGTQSQGLQAAPLPNFTQQKAALPHPCSPSRPATGGSSGWYGRPTLTATSSHWVLPHADCGVGRQGSRTSRHSPAAGRLVQGKAAASGSQRQHHCSQAHRAATRDGDLAVAVGDRGGGQCIEACAGLCLQSVLGRQTGWRAGSRSAVWMAQPLQPAAAASQSCRKQRNNQAGVLASTVSRPPPSVWDSLGAMARPLASTARRGDALL